MKNHKSRCKINSLYTGRKFKNCTRVNVIKVGTVKHNCHRQEDKTSDRLGIILKIMSIYPWQIYDDIGSKK